MIRRKNTPGGPDTRHFASPKPNQYRWHAPYVNSKATINQNIPNSWIQDSNRPHLNVILDKKHKIKALVDSGSTICLADESILKHITNKSSPGPPINVTDCHNNRKATQGCYKAMIDIEDNLPHPMKDKPINIHVTKGVSSQLILGTDFLKENGAIINVRDNTVAFLSEDMATIAKCSKPILREAIASSTEIKTLYDDLIETHPDTYMIQPIENKILGHMDQITFHAQVITTHSFILQPGTTVLVTSNIAPAPYVPDGLYNIKDNNLVQITIKNTDICPLQLRKNQPITGITVQVLNEGDYEEVPKSYKLLQACFPPEEEGAKHNDPIKKGHESATDERKNSHPTATNLPQATSLLEATGLDPPGVRDKPSQKPSPEISKNLLDQFDTKDIEQEWIPAYKQLIIDNYDVFSLDKFDVGHTPHYHHRIERTTDRPIYVKQFQIPTNDEKSLDEFAINLTAAHVLIEQPSVHNTPIFMVAKRGGANVGKKRFVQDFRKQNAASQDDKYTIRDVRESLTAVGRLKPRLFSKCDFTGAFYSLPLEKSSQPLTSFTLPFLNKQFSWTRMPQGLKGASASFSKLCQIIFRNIQNVITYVDDLMAAATTHQEMISLLNKIFEECRYHGMKLNLKKCILGVFELTWLGYALNEFGISPEYDKAEAVKTMIPPKTIKEVQSHLGLFQFFCELIKDYALIAAPLGAVTSPHNHWRGERLSGPLPSGALNAWKKLIDIISSRPAISFPDFNIPFQLHVETYVGQEHHNPPIRGGLSATLTQIQDGTTRPIGYYSRQFRESECKYNAYNAELAGIVSGLKHFYQYLKGSRTTVITDHLPTIQNGRRDNNTMNSLKLKMHELDIHLLHIRGGTTPINTPHLQPIIKEAQQATKEIKQAAATSSLDIKPAFPITMSDLQWRFEQKRDTTCREMRDYVDKRRLSLIPEVKNIIELYGHKAMIDQPSELLYIYTARNKHMTSKRLWVPEVLTNMIMTNHHGSTLTGHAGEIGTYERIATKYFWPTMIQDIGRFVRQCKKCHQQKDAKANNNKAPLRVWKTPTHRNMRIHMDLVGPLTPSQGCTHILTITDAFTRYTELIPIPNKQTITVAKALLDEWILRHGFYEQVISDHGGEFVSDVMIELNEILKMRHHVISPYSPHVNGQIERVHRTMGSYLKTYCDNTPTEWTDFIPSLRFALNTRIHSSTKMSPYFMTYMEHPTFPWSQNKHLSYSESDVISKVRLLNHARELILSNSDEAKAASKKAYDIKTKTQRFEPGEKVLLHYPNPPKGTSRKLYSPWRGIYTVIRRDNDLIYQLRKKGGRLKIAHINRIKYYDPENSKSDKDTHISYEDDEEAETTKLPSVRTTRSNTNNLPPPINRYTSANKNLAIAENRQNTPSFKTRENHSNNAKFADEFNTIFG